MQRLEMWLFQNSIQDRLSVTGRSTSRANFHLMAITERKFNKCSFHAMPFTPP